MHTERVRNSKIFTAWRYQIHNLAWICLFVRRRSQLLAPSIAVCETGLTLEDRSLSRIRVLYSPCQDWIIWQAYFFQDLAHLADLIKSIADSRRISMKTRRRRLEKSDISLNDCVRVVLDKIAAPQAHDKTAICTIVNTARRRLRKNEW